MVRERSKRGRKPAPISVVGGIEHKHCSGCKDLKPLSAYKPNRGGKLHAKCRPCLSIAAQAAKRRQIDGTAKKHGPMPERRKERFVNGAREKWCNLCKSFVAESAFAKNKSRYDGLHAYCLACNRTKQAADRARRGEEYREMRRRYRKTESGFIAYNRYRKVHPGKTYAHKETQDAIRRGVLVRPEVCDECENTGTIDAHHDDYAKTFEVRWLCRWCHQKWHREHGEAKNADLPAPKLREQQKERIRQRRSLIPSMVAGGLSQKEIAAELGVTTPTIWSDLKALNLSLR